MPIAAAVFFFSFSFFGVDLPIANIILFDKKLFNFFLIVSLLFFRIYESFFYVIGRRHVCFCIVTFLFCEFSLKTSQFLSFFFSLFSKKNNKLSTNLHPHSRDIFMHQCSGKCNVLFADNEPWNRKQKRF
jgi:prepilin-type processing-associated H-X9-DG protein